jgi:hypothetical protein
MTPTAKSKKPLVKEKVQKAVSRDQLVATRKTIFDTIGAFCQTIR